MRNALNSLVILGHYLAARRRFTVFRDRRSLEDWQATRLQRHLRWVARWSPFYRAWFGAEKHGPVGELSSWPRTGKQQVTRHLDEWLTSQVELAAARETAHRAGETRDFTHSLPGNITVGLSSGTTGPAAMFFVSARERAAWAGLALARTLREPSLRRPERIAFFLRANSPLYETLGSQTVSFAFFDLQQPVETGLEKLAQTDPTVIIAPPNVLRLLAGARIAGRLQVSPRQIISVAEVLESDDRTAVENAFALRVDEVYQASEGFLAATCPAGSLHWNEDVVKVEADVLGGGRYHPILTDFRRRLQPVIRYRLNDVVVDEAANAPPCGCGSVFRRIRRIEGRQDDSLRLPCLRGTEVGTLFPDFVRLAVSAAAAGRLEDFRVRQVDLGTVGVSLRPEPSSTTENVAFLRRLEHALAADCARAGLRVPVCRWLPWSEVAQNDGPKRRRVVGLPARDVQP